MEVNEYVICKIKMPKDMAWRQVKGLIQKKGCEVQTTGEILHIEGFVMPAEFEITQPDEVCRYVSD